MSLEQRYEVESQLASYGKQIYTKGKRQWLEPEPLVPKLDNFFQGFDSLLNLYNQQLELAQPTPDWSMISTEVLHAWLRTEINLSTFLEIERWFIPQSAWKTYNQTREFVQQQITQLNNNLAKLIDVAVNLPINRQIDEISERLEIEEHIIELRDELMVLGEKRGWVYNEQMKILNRKRLRVSLDLQRNYVMETVKDNPSVYTTMISGKYLQSWHRMYWKMYLIMNDRESRQQKNDGYYQDFTVHGTAEQHSIGLATHLDILIECGLKVIEKFR